MILVDHLFLPVVHLRNLTFSDFSIEAHAVGSKPTSCLEKMSIVRQIMAERMSVDTNSNGRLDELEELLRKHSAAFSDERDIANLGSVQ